MMDNTLLAWGALLLLGGLHGVNPGMGWLFAVALGLQERDGRAVWRSLLPLAAGHALAVAAAVAALIVIGSAVPPHVLRWIVAATLLATGVLHLRHRLHPRRTGMRVGPRDLVIWSFLMATAHGAGLMALPFVPAAAGAPSAHAGANATADRADGPHAAHASHSKHTAHAGHPGVVTPAGARPGRLLGLAAALVHTLGYLLTTGLVATIVYYRLGLRLLQRTWINMDIIWAGALIATAVLIPLL
jgi:hypothetical protein